MGKRKKSQCENGELMIYCIVRLSERGECGEVMDEGLAAREYNAGLTPCYQAFADRLEALGMTLDGR